MAALERERRNHELDLEALRQKFKHELPLVQKTLLANDVTETKLVIESIRQHYSNELETKRQQVRGGPLRHTEEEEEEEKRRRRGKGGGEA